MRTAIVNYLKKVREIPEGKFPPVYYTPPMLRMFIFGTFVYPLGFATHALFLVVFAFLGVKWLALFNILSVTMWATSFFLHRNGYFNLGFAIVTIEVIAHAGLCVIFLGWAAGFQFYLVPIPVVVFFTHWHTSRKALIALLFCVSFVLMHYYIRPLKPIVELDPIYLSFLYYGNYFSVSFVFATFSYSFYIATISAEEKLETAHHRTNSVLKQLNGELSEAAGYVKKILPQPVTKGSIRTNWRFIPSTSLGGDAFGYHKVDEDHFAVYLIDVSGHGVGAALLSVSVINMLRSQSLPSTDFKDPQQVLQALNLAFPSESHKDMFFTIWYGVYNLNTRELTYASAGHPPAILCSDATSSDCKIDLLKTPNFVVGAIGEAAYNKSKCNVEKGGTLYIFSDGVYEVEKSDGSMWCFKEFAEYLKTIKLENKPILDRLYEYARNLGKSDRFEDDFTILEVAFV